jgi:ABC-type branched-subunit amino acid transport system permease subunit
VNKTAFRCATSTLVGVLLLIVLPACAEPYLMMSLTSYLIFAILALSLALVWGFGGVLSFGQSIFFGLGGYAYAIAVLNLGESSVPVLLGVLIPVGFAAILGYFMFWGRISDVYLAVMTLVVSLILFHAVNAMSGASYRIGTTPIGGLNGIPGVPPINLPGDASQALEPAGLYRLSLAILLASYWGLRALLASDFGCIVIAIRENETRATFLGYDTRRYKLAVFMVGAGIAGMAGVLFTAWGSFIGPSVFSIVFASQIIMSVLIGGLGTLAGAVAGAFLIQALTTWLGESKVADANLITGLLFMIFVLAIPKGIQPTVSNWIVALQHRKANKPSV